MWRMCPTIVSNLILSYRLISFPIWQEASCQSDYQTNIFYFRSGVLAIPMARAFRSTACRSCTRIRIHYYYALLNPCDAKSARIRISKNTLLASVIF